LAFYPPRPGESAKITKKIADLLKSENSMKIRYRPQRRLLILLRPKRRRKGKNTARTGPEKI
jgi:hypothetical protein